ncbi:glycosyltransferase family 8 protein [Amniculicola lignicola CBS 123094]|uniref:Glycosyltransferase family 8 protein n=1 Tax=Amniculicola lignicola CBS 123094 TaxID=1392246 RepID=A0A6A5X4B9_9PLEO|nr:glycosyltransferase family 8 protein [Amniculicola lignicola CBS 123094]
MSNNNAYATLLTRPSYLAGVILLAYTLHKCSPSTPLIVLHTPGDTLPKACIDALELEAASSNIILRKVDHVKISMSEAKDEGDGGRGKEIGMVAERFADTWTKLRVFELHGMGFEKICFLDADMLVLRDPSEIVFKDAPWEDVDGHGVDKKMGLLAAHVCVCNLDGDSWAPGDWNRGNCAYTDSQWDEIPAVDPDSSTRGIFNSGTFVFHPSLALSVHVFSAFANTPPATLQAFQFPDQDFLNMVFRGKWRGLSWTVNALKTWRHWHPEMWRDDEVRVVHYIVDKPWAARVVRDGEGKMVAGYKGLDGETHGWWWEVWEEWKGRRLPDGKGEVEIVERWIIGEQGENKRDDLKTVGAGAQDFAKKWENGNSH